MARYEYFLRNRILTMCMSKVQNHGKSYQAIYPCPGFLVVEVFRTLCRYTMTLIQHKSTSIYERKTTVLLTLGFFQGLTSFNNQSALLESLKIGQTKLIHHKGNVKIINPSKFLETLRPSNSDIPRFTVAASMSLWHSNGKHKAPITPTCLSTVVCAAASLSVHSQMRRSTRP